LLGEPCSAVGLDSLCSMVTMATKLFTVSLCRESRRISSSRNFLFKNIICYKHLNLAEMAEKRKCGNNSVSSDNKKFWKEPIRLISLHKSSI
jgi:hypothetical protein